MDKEILLWYFNNKFYFIIWTDLTSRSKSKATYIACYFTITKNRYFFLNDFFFFFCCYINSYSQYFIIVNSRFFFIFSILYLRAGCVRFSLKIGVLIFYFFLEYFYFITTILLFYFYFKNHFIAAIVQFNFRFSAF